MLSFIYAQCHKIGHYAECRYVNCRYTECRSAYNGLNKRYLMHIFS
jgi:hypothetical protein